MLHSGHRSVALVLAVAFAACSRGADSKTIDSADGEMEEPKRKGPPYKVVPVTAAGVITGTVTPPAAPAPAPAGACAAQVAAPGQSIVVYLEDIARGRGVPAGAPRRHELAVAPCTLTPGVSIASAGGTLNLSNALNAVHRVAFTFEGMKTPMLRVPFSDPGQLVPSERVLAVPGVVEVASDQDPSMRARIVVLEHPYAVVASDGRFTLDSVPPGTYSLVALGAHGRAAASVTVQAGATTNAVLMLR